MNNYSKSINTITQVTKCGYCRVWGEILAPSFYTDRCELVLNTWNFFLKCSLHFVRANSTSNPPECPLPICRHPHLYPLPNNTSLIWSDLSLTRRLAGCALCGRKTRKRTRNSHAHAFPLTCWFLGITKMLSPYHFAAISSIACSHPKNQLKAPLDYFVRTNLGLNSHASSGRFLR